MGSVQRSVNFYSVRTVTLYLQNNKGNVYNTLIEHQYIVFEHLAAKVGAAPTKSAFRNDKAVITAFNLCLRYIKAKPILIWSESKVQSDIILYYIKPTLRLT